MGMIDSHAHLTDEHLSGDVAGLLNRARDAGVDGVITVAQDVADAERCVELARTHDSVWATAGIHPHEAGKVTDADWSRLEALLSSGQVVACGEIGLDYHYDFADVPTQQTVFARQLEIAHSTSLPLVVHCRKAFADTIRLLADGGFDGRPVVFHCFSGTVADAEALASHDWWMSFTGSVTFKSAREVREVARTCPADRLMIETDAPYLAPVPIRGTFPNEPAYLVHTARFLADLRDQPPDELAAQTGVNTRNFFGLPPG